MFGSDKRYYERSRPNGTRSFICWDNVYQLPPGDWTEELRVIKIKLEAAGFFFPGEDLLVQKLSFLAKIDTILNKPNDYRVYDAVFYWND